MRSFCLILFVPILSCVTLHGQTDNAYFSEAEELLANKQFGTALKYYQELLKTDPSNANLNFRTGICYLNSRSQKDKANSFLNKAVSPTTSYYQNKTRTTSREPVISHEYLGNGNLSCDLEKLRIELRIDFPTRELIPEYVAYTAIWNTEKEIMNLQFGQGKNEQKKSGDKNFFENINFAKESGTNDPLNSRTKSSSLARPQAKFFGSNTTLDTLRGNEATVAVSEDSHVILLYRNENGEGHLYITRLSNNQWTVPEKLSKALNEHGWEFNESISADGHWLYFTSDREGGFGGKDIYRCEKLLNGEWSKANNLGSHINSRYDEEAPLILPDGISLYFSSNKNQPSGSFEIFNSSLSDQGIWTEPIRTGYPKNLKQPEPEAPLTATTNSNPTFIKVLPDLGSKNYVFAFPNKNKIPLMVLKGKITDMNNETIRDIKITVTDNQSGQIINSYYSDDKTGSYLILLPPQKNSNVTYTSNKYLFQSENFNTTDETKAIGAKEKIQLYPDSVGSAILLNNVFFEPDKSTLLPGSTIELNNIVDLLETNTVVSAEISAFVLPVEGSKADPILAQERAEKIRQYLYSKGIEKSRLNAQGYIKYRPPVHIKKNSDKVISENNEMNQWVELRIAEKPKSNKKTSKNKKL